MQNKKLVGFLTIGLAALVLLFGSFYVINPGERGVLVTLGSVSSTYKSEGVGLKLPLISDVIRISVRQEAEGLETAAFSSDLQTVSFKLKVLYRIPEESVIPLYQQYSGRAFDSLIAPRVQEALKETTALESAEGLTKKRETVKVNTLELTRKKIGTIISIDDIVIENIDLSNELELAIEQKMVQEQEAAKAKFKQQQAEIDAKTMVIKAEGESLAIKKRGDAIRQNPGVIDLMIAEKWNGVSPLVVGGEKGGNLLLPLNKKD